ncbi:MAG: ABC transporter ATP-binding protein [Lachnospiraceae bacterium]|nr:ABC transporter ATP-binding protein [Lachnospiraceae bacterium]
MRNNIIVKSFRALFTADRVLFVISYGLTFMQGVTRVLPIITIQLLFDALADIGKPGGQGKGMLCLLLFTGSRIIKHLISLATNYTYEKYDLVAGRGMKKNVNEKVVHAPAICFENTEFLEKVNKADRGTDSIRRFIDVWMMVLLLYVPEVATVLVYLYKANPWLLLVLLPIILPSAVVIRLQEKEFARQEENCANLSRKLGIYHRLLFDVRSIMETQVAGYKELLKKKSFACIAEKAEWEYRYDRTGNRLENIEKLTILAGRILIFGILVICTQKGMVSIGVFAALLSSLDELFAIVEEILSAATQGVSESLEKIRNYFGMIEDQSHVRQGDRELERIDDIVFQNVGFQYPGSNQPAIRNMTLKIKRGEHIAVVGENGSGKSTFVKLLCGLYPCTTGTVQINGEDISGYSDRTVYDKFTAVFQQFGKYAMTVKENIILGFPENTVRYQKLLRETGFGVTGTKTNAVLSREYGGVDLSGGQWQKIAICRARYKDGEVYLLDEPTSAIDPKEEKKLYDLFDDMTRGKTSIIVTHRMSAARLASGILVLRKGEVCGYGTHEELLKTCEEYRRLWNSQAQMYA